MKSVVSFITIIFLMAGCSGAEIKTVSATAEQKIIEKNDTQLRISTKGLCSAALSAISRELAGDPERLEALLTYCNWSNGNVEIWKR